MRKSKSVRNSKRRIGVSERRSTVHTSSQPRLTHPSHILTLVTRSEEVPKPQASIQRVPMIWGRDLSRTVAITISIKEKCSNIHLHRWWLVSNLKLPSPLSPLRIEWSLNSQWRIEDWRKIWQRTITKSLGWTKTCSVRQILTIMNSLRL